jgi:hypothetical protein
MIAKARDVLCLYHYDPLDRLIGTTPINDAGLQRFYCKDRVVTEVQGALQLTVGDRSGGFGIADSQGQSL